MKNAILLIAMIFLALWGTVAQAFDGEKVVYGIDSRKEVFESASQLADLANSTAAMIPKKYVKPGTDGTISISPGSTLQMAQNLCDSERFLTQPTPAVCSGFLVAPDVLVTAGHCIKTESDCANYAWVFDYNMKNDNEANLKLSSSSVYYCKSIISRELDRTTKNDYAVITLDRSTGRKPLPVRTSGAVQENADLVVIGHPSGLPSKINDGGTMRLNTNSIFFVANLDTFGGNSGSVVFDTKSGLVEGILVRGENDYTRTAEGCNIVNVCEEGKCRGEDVTRITNLSKYIPQAQ